jgi:hypothetical protein
MNEDQKQLAIIAQSTAKAAATLCHGQGLDAITSGAFSACFETIYNEVMSRVPGQAPVQDLAQPVGGEATFAPGMDAVEDQLIAAFTAPGGAAPVMVDQGVIPIARPAPAPVAVPGIPPLPAPIAVQGASGHTPGPATVIGLNSSMIDMLEDALFHNPTNWKVWDSEKSSVQGGTSADITHEELKNAKGYSLGIWMVDNKYGKRSAPEWAFIEMGKAPQFAALVAAGTITP